MLFHSSLLCIQGQKNCGHKNKSLRASAAQWPALKMQKKKILWMILDIDKPPSALQLRQIEAIKICKAINCIQIKS
jgi:hypothetical protein